MATMIRALPYFLLLLPNVLAYSLPEDGHYLSKRLPEDLEKRANDLRLWIPQGGDANDVYKNPVFRSKKGSGSANDCPSMAKDGWSSVQTQRRAWNSNKKKEQKPTIEPEAQNLVATLFVPGKGLYTASSAYGPGKNYFNANIATLAPVLNHARGQKGANDIHVEDMILFYFESDNKGFLDQVGHYPPGTVVKTYGKGSRTDSEGAKPACSRCRTILTRLQVAY
ncbi:hypothetical protein MMC06_002834 [Schaereria dolodes]|nr:hypothetical protein [Schaereria dolodes]